MGEMRAAKTKPKLLCTLSFDTNPYQVAGLQAIAALKSAGIAPLLLSFFLWCQADDNLASNKCNDIGGTERVETTWVKLVTCPHKAEYQAARARGFLAIEKSYFWESLRRVSVQKRLILSLGRGILLFCLSQYTYLSMLLHQRFFVSVPSTRFL